LFAAGGAGVGLAPACMHGLALPGLLVLPKRIYCMSILSLTCIRQDACRTSLAPYIKFGRLDIGASRKHGFGGADLVIVESHSHVLGVTLYVT
jgi:hypothetical protein